MNTVMDGSSRADLISLANSEVSIYTVLGKLGVDYAAYYGTTAKLNCPFGHISHIDGGYSKAMRVYPDTNSCYCFACSTYFTPVKMFSDAHDLSLEDAARFLLEDSGWEPETYESKWDKLVQPSVFNPYEVQEALDSACRRRDKLWNVKVTFEPYKSAYQECLKVLEYVDNASKAELWLEQCKEKMFGVIDAQE